MLSLFKRANGTYDILYLDGTKRKWKSAGSRYKPEALRRIEEFHQGQPKTLTRPEEHNQEQPIPPRPDTLNAFAEGREPERRGLEHPEFRLIQNKDRQTSCPSNQ